MAQGWIPLADRQNGMQPDLSRLTLFDSKQHKLRKRDRDVKTFVRVKSREFPTITDFMSLTQGDENVFLPIESSIYVLDPWNGVEYKEMEAVLADKTLDPCPEIPGINKKRKEYVEKYKQRAPLDAGKLREKHPHCIPVNFEAGSGITEIGAKKFLVPAKMPLGEFVKAIQRWFRLSRSMFVYIMTPETVPSTDALMSEIDEKHKGKDGFLHMIYSKFSPSDAARKRKTAREKLERAGVVFHSKDILVLDPWNASACKVYAADKSIPGHPNPDMDHKMKEFIEEHEFYDIDARVLRETRPDLMPVSVEKDEMSDLPDIDAKKFHVHGDMPLGEFVEFVQMMIGYFENVSVHFKNTGTERLFYDTLMSEIDEESRDGDGYLRMTYSGVDRGTKKKSKNAPQKGKKGSKNKSKSVKKHWK